jgi:RNA polymerase sigma-B factor
MARAAPPDPTESLRASCDRLEAMLTCPTEPSAHRAWVGRGAARPATDLALWTSHVALHRHRRPRDRSRLVEHYHHHARRLAQRYFRHGEPVDDLEQVALEGLVLALERFDPTRGLPFLGFANPTIAGSLKHHYRDAGWAIRVPRRVHDLSQPLRSAHEQLAQDLGREPSASEVADLLGVDEEEVRVAMEAERVRCTASIDAVVSPDGDSSLKDRMGAVDPGLSRVDDLVSLQAALRHIDDEARELIGLYFEDGLTQQEIGRRLGVSQMQVSRLLDRVLSQLRSHIPST